MNPSMDRRRKNSIYDTQPPSIVASQNQLSYRKRRYQQAKRNSRDKDFFAPDEVEEWVLPEYRSLFHHLFLKEDEDSSTEGLRRNSTSSNSPSQRQRKISPTESTGSGNGTSNEEDGPLCNFVRSFPTWLKKIFHISENEQQPIDEAADRHAWLDEIPIEICDKLRHIHIYV